MLNFSSDYLEGAHPLILENLMKTNMEKTPGYGLDPYSEKAKQKIKDICKKPDAEVYFLVGGTQTNATVIKGILHYYEGVIAAETGHIATHEAGAIEAGGHKILTLPHENGKISAKSVSDFIDIFNKDGNNAHMVQPGMVYISHPTEYGALYSAQELQDLHDICKKHNIPLFLDGARLGYGLAARNTDVTLEVIAETCDVFYIGGTKVGALFGEAIIIPQKGLVSHFFTFIKQQGALLAKGRILGIQFDTLFSDNLYLNIAKHAIDMAEKLKKGFADKNYRFFYQSPTNQQFIILENEKMAELAQKVIFSFWETYDDNHTVVRFATSWATNEADIDQLLAII
ncbi:low specificity L-threonine aldolase [Bartonella sp. HY038]|uniref:threonine aldolase family protein n=1 Tax=Bartonella sp. HY038 TaxID=2759660 RepID=UPI0015F82AC2|nr:beta-eliminating lyase-related protein [Bartonella sp. HY038]